MEFYKKRLVPDELKPDWEYVQRLPNNELYELSGLSFGVDMYKLDGEIHREKECLKNNKELIELKEEYENSPPWDCRDAEEKRVKDKEKELSERLLKLEALRNNIDGLFLLAIEHIDNGSLKSNQEYPHANKINTFEYVRWLDTLKIPCPKELKNCIRPTESSIDKPLTPSEKSSLTQENNQLKKLLNEIITRNYGEGVTAYEIKNKDNNSTVSVIHTSEQTIRKYLNK